MSLSTAIVLSSVLALAFAIVYAETRLRALNKTVVQRDECLRYIALVAAHRAGDRPLVEEIESLVSEEEDAVATGARQTAFEMDPKESEAREAA